MSMWCLSCLDLRTSQPWSCLAMGKPSGYIEPPATIPGFKGKDNYDSGKGKSKGRDSKGRTGPPVLDSVRQTIPKGLNYTATEDGRHAQLPPLNEPAQPSLEAIFDSSNPHSIVEYPRYLAEPVFECERGHKILLSRIPWQSGCALCQVLGQA